MEDLRGLADAFPMTAFAFGLATFTLVGLPPSAGFSAKWHLITASLESGQWWWAPVIVGGSLLTGCLPAARLLVLLPGVQDARWTPRGTEVPPARAMEIVAFLTALLAAAARAPHGRGRTN
jgi:multicomponent Na+:H+ antiporter subunit D